MEIEENCMVSKENKKMIIIIWNYFEGYDGPLHYTMVNDNPDQVISILPISDSMDGKEFYLVTLDYGKLSFKLISLLL